MSAKRRVYRERFIKEALKDPSLRRLHRKLRRKTRGGVREPNPSTFFNYTWGVMDLAKFKELDRAVDLLETKDWEKALDDWIDDMTERLAPGTINLNVYGVKKWLKANRVKVDWDEVELVVQQGMVEDKAPSREVLRRLMAHSSLKMKVAITLAISSAIRPGALVHLKLEDLDLTPPDIGIIRVKAEYPGNKLKQTYYTLMTPEAKRFLEEWLEYRERQGEELTSESWVLGKLSYHGLRVAWSRLLKKVGLTEKSGGQHIYHFHTLRKYFRTFCGLDERVRERLMGHKGKYLDDSYFRPPEKDVLNAYLEAIPHLTIYTVGEAVTREQHAKSIEELFRFQMDVNKLGLEKAVQKWSKKYVDDKTPVEERGVIYPVLVKLIEEMETGEEADEEVREDVNVLNNEGETNGGNIQKIIKPVDLEEYLERGYHAKFQLADGRIVVERT